MKRIISLVLCVLIALGCVGMASAAFNPEKIEKYDLNDQKIGKITASEPMKIYEFNVPTSGKIDVTFSALIKRVSIKILDAAEKEIWSNDPWSDSSSQQISVQDEVYLTGGKYYFTVNKNNGFGDFNFKITFTSATETFVETQAFGNNKTADANPITIGTRYYGQLAHNDANDYYKFEIAKSGKVKAIYSSQIKGSTVKIIDESGKEVWSTNATISGDARDVNCSGEAQLLAGTYYFVCSRNTGYGNYNFRFEYSSSNETFSERQGATNNTTKTAELAGINSQYAGQLAVNDEVDVYRISIASKKKVKIVFSAGIKSATLKITDSAGKTVWQAKPKSTTMESKVSFSEEVTLNKGAHYLYIQKDNGEGNYAFFVTDGGKITVVTNPITVLLNDQKILFDQLPIIENSRTLVPVRAIFEALNATVNWDQETKTITSQKGNISIKMTIGSKTMYKNGNPITLDTPPQIINSRTLVPVRAIAEAYGCSVNWDGATRTVIIKGQ